jgi:hypothetical protein
MRSCKIDKAETGSIARVPAPEIETLVRDGVRRHLAVMGDGEPATATADRDLIERHVARVIVKPQALKVCHIPTKRLGSARRLIDTFGPNQSGKFYNYDGREYPW